MNLWLIDTGPVVAYLDASDPYHAEVCAVMDGFSGRSVTTPAVITEAMYFLGATPGGAQALATLVDRSGMTVYDVCQPADLRLAARLMDRYADTPMDFADATLLLLADVLEIVDVLTLDRRGFATYRTAEGRGMRLVMDGGGGESGIIIRGIDSPRAGWAEAAEKLHERGEDEPLDEFIAGDFDETEWVW